MNHKVTKYDKLNGCIDPDSLNKALDLLFGLVLGNSTNDNPTMVSSIWRLFRGFTCCGSTLIVKWCWESTNMLYIVEENGSKNGFLAPKISSKMATSSCDSESRFSGLLELLWVWRQQVGSLRSLQNECVVFVPLKAAPEAHWSGSLSHVRK